MPGKKTRADDKRPAQARINGKLGGRPEGSVSLTTLQKREMRAQLVAEAHRRQAEISSALFDAALGHFKESEVRDPDTGEVIGHRVYKRSPNPEMLSYLLDQVIDKAVQQVEMRADVQTDNPLTDDERKLLRQALAFAATPQPEAKFEPPAKDGGDSGE